MPLFSVSTNDVVCIGCKSLLMSIRAWINSLRCRSQSMQVLPPDLAANILVAEYVKEAIRTREKTRLVQFLFTALNSDMTQLKFNLLL